MSLNSTRSPNRLFARRKFSSRWKRPPSIPRALCSSLAAMASDRPSQSREVGWAWAQAPKRGRRVSWAAVVGQDLALRVIVDQGSHNGRLADPGLAGDQERRRSLLTAPFV